MSVFRPLSPRRRRLRTRRQRPRPSSTSRSRVGDVAVLSVFPDRFRARDKRGAALRFLKLTLLDVPIVHYADGLNQEFGHIAKANEIGIGLQLRLVGGP